jgi:predicted patatin/cPLA2 family phospholipase
MHLENNIKDTALIFEGGGMRASYTAGFLNILLENGLYFDYVAGISAGSSHSVNYLSRDTQRAKKSFVDLVLDPRFGGWGSFFKGEGYFRARYLYEETPYPDACLPFDFETFQANPARLRVGAFRRESGEMIYFSKEDMRDVGELMKIVRCSSSMPIFMPPTWYDGNYYVDGGLGGGIALDIAKQDGMKRFFAVLSRPKGFRMQPPKWQGAIRTLYKKRPHMADAMMSRYQVYNRTLDELMQLAREGKAYIVYPDTMPVTNRETNFEKLSASYRMGYAQGKRELAEWKEFLGRA